MLVPRYMIMLMHLFQEVCNSVTSLSYQGWDQMAQTYLVGPAPVEYQNHCRQCCVGQSHWFCCFDKGRLASKADWAGAGPYGSWAGGHLVEDAILNWSDYCLTQVLHIWPAMAICRLGARLLRSNDHRIGSGTHRWFEGESRVHDWSNWYFGACHPE